jgi:radial spoke head protein 9
VEGLAKSYYVLLGLTFRKAYEFPHKTFFYAYKNNPLSLSSDFEFKELPDLLLQHEGLSEKFNAMPFLGDPAKVLVNVEGEGEPQEGQAAEEGAPEGKTEKLEDEEDETKKVPKKNFTELARLAHVVRAIEHDSQCVPRGSYRMTPEHELRANANFYGLDTTSARAQANWLHFRAPITLHARRAIEDDMVVFNSSFLDTIESDSPSGSWTVQIDAKQRNSSLRSLKWPGYFAFHRLNSSVFGSAYIGDGTKNVDLPFMI